MTDVAPAEPEVLTDEAILARFQRSKNQPTGSQTLGFRIVAVSQADKSVEVEFEAKPELLLNPMKQVQGGYLCAMLDECMSVACMVASGMTHVAPTAEMSQALIDVLARPKPEASGKDEGRTMKSFFQLLPKAELKDYAEGRKLRRVERSPDFCSGP